MPCEPSSSSPCAVPDQAKSRKTKKKGRKRAKTEPSSSSSMEAEANALDVNVSLPPILVKYPSASVPPPAAAAKSRKTKKKKRGKTKKNRGKTEPSSNNITWPWLKGKKKETTTATSAIYDPAIHRQLHAMYDEDYRKEYCKQLRATATSAFDVTVSPPVGKYGPYGWVMPIRNLHSNSKSAKSRRIVLNFSADFALQRYNSLHNGNYVFKELVKATRKGTRGLYYFITFLAEDATHDECGGGVKTFQAAVLRFIGEIKVRYCELKTEPSSSSKEALEPTPPCHPPANIHYDYDRPYDPSFFDVDFRKKYFKQLTLTDAFDVNVLPKDRNNLPCCYIFPVPDLHVTSTRILLEYLANKALDDYRMDRLGDYDFKKLVKANARGCGGVEYYITFLGEDATKGVKTFQAAVLYEKGKAEVWYCKLKATN